MRMLRLRLWFATHRIYGLEESEKHRLEILTSFDNARTNMADLMALPMRTPAQVRRCAYYASLAQDREVHRGYAKRAHERLQNARSHKVKLTQQLAMMS